MNLILITISVINSLSELKNSPEFELQNLFGDFYLFFYSISRINQLEKKQL